MQADRYEVLVRIGAGGMGEVYRARDRRLDRNVALKALPVDVAASPTKRARFEREAQSVAALNHPHICALYDVVSQGGREWLVLEYVEGETLEERLRAGPLPLREVLRHAADLADALDSAHRAGIVHRDVKPSNIMLTASGVKLLDFGIAKLLDLDAISQEPPSPTASLTAERLILGTLRYMAPEQLEARPVDARTDIFALGAVLYKMATGCDAFGGESPASQIAAVLTAEPPPITRDARGTPIPPALDHVVHRCLAKDPDARWQSSRDVKAELDWIADIADGGVRTAHASRAAFVWSGLGLMASSAVLVAALTANGSRSATPPAPGPVVFGIAAPPGVRLLPSPYSMAVSPDGRHVAFLAAEQDQGDTLLWIRDLDMPVARVLPGTDRAMRPFWSGDSRSVAFFTGDTLKKIAIAGGPAETICQTPPGGPGGWPGAWSRDGTIVFAPADNVALWRVSAAGGTPTPLTHLDRASGELWHGHPQFLPDREHFLFNVGHGETGHQMVSIGSLGSVQSTPLFAATSNAEYAAPGYLLFMQGATLMARPFDAPQRRLSGDPVPLATDVIFNPLTSKGMFSVSETGVLAYRTSPTRRIAWYDRHGHLLGTMDALGSAMEPTVSPDGRRLAVSRREPGTDNSDIWACDIASGACAAVTSKPSSETAPLWSRDGRDVLFSSDRGGVHGIYRRKLDAGTPDELIHTFDGQGESDLFDLIDDRHVITGGAPRGEITAEVTIVGLGAESVTVPLFPTRRDGTDVRVSPDGRWMAYSAMSRGRFEVFVRSFHGGDGAVQVSTSGGTSPRWRRDGGELYYLAPDRRVMAVTVHAGQPFRVERPAGLFSFEADTSSTGIFRPAGRNQYDVTPDGQRFVVSERVGEPTITVVVNWPALLRR